MAGTAAPKLPPSLHEILSAFQANGDGDGDRELLLLILKAKRAEEEVRPCSL